ncbi:MAG: SBBP repeat-containing protein, partial [Acidobacteria bacterium]|nr:SBBP repeat-containing protein [Acidobacteriota bacterium]
MKLRFVLTICSALALATIPPPAIPRESGAMHRGPAQLATASANGQGAANARVRENFGNLPLYLVENRGQLNKQVAFYAQGSNTTIYFTSQGLTFALNDERQSRESQKSFPLQQGALKGDTPRAGPRSRYALALNFVNVRPGLLPTGRQQTSAVFSYFKGSRDRWQVGLRSFSRVAYENVWPGIDLVFDGTVNRMKYTFIIKPGADPNQIRMSYRGAIGLKVNQGGELEVETPAGVLTDERPVAWQEEKGRKVGVASEYLPEVGTRDGEHRYGFSIGDYDRGRELVIDPEMLVYSGYIGGSGDELCYSIAVDSVGNAYVTGLTNSSDLPVAVGPDTSFNGHEDAFVAKVRA